MTRPHGRANIDPSNPRALGVCDRCGSLYNHYQLKWQYDWRGVKLQNLRFLVCESCYDEPQQSGQRTIILPPDPESVMNARPENYVEANNPLSALGANPDPRRSAYSAQIGNMTRGGGVPAAFDSNANKSVRISATIVTPVSSYGNYVGINWSEYPSVTPVLTHTLSSYAITAPNNATFGSTGYAVQGSNTAVSWTTLASGNTAQTIGETISGTPTTGGRYQFHRVAFYGGSSPIAVAQVSFSVTDGSSWGQ